MKIEFVPQFRPTIRITVESTSEDYALRHFAEQITMPGVRLGWFHKPSKSKEDEPGFIEFYPEEIPDDIPKATQ